MGNRPFESTLLEGLLTSLEWGSDCRGEIRDNFSKPLIVTGESPNFLWK